MKYFLFIATMFTSALLCAEPMVASEQKPMSVHVAPDSGMFVFYATVTAGEKPQCAGDNRWSVKTDKPGAKELISMVIAAKLADRTITAQGTGHCNPDGWGYQIAHVYLN